MATFTQERIVRTGNGLTATYNTPTTGGDKFSPGSNVFVVAKNTNGATRTITFVTSGKVSEFDIADMSAVIPATTGEKFLGPFPGNLFAGTDGLVQMTYTPDPPTNVTIAVLKLEAA